MLRYLALLLTILATTLPAQTLTRWRHDAAGAFSITMDDNCLRQLSVVRPLLNARGIHATYFIPDPGSQTNLALLRQAAADGHEIASHSLTHGDLTQMDSATADNDLKRSRALIDSLIPSQRCVTFAYPYCSTNDAVRNLARRYYLASRTCVGLYVTSPNPADFQNISSVGYASDTAYGPSLRSGTLNAYVDEVIRRGGWIVTMIHDFDASGTGWVSSDTFTAHLDYIVSKGDRVFCAPFGLVTRYIKERQCATFSLLVDNGSSRTYTLSDTLSDDALFSVPITATLKLPAGWASAIVTQNGLPCWSTQRSDTLVFEAVPDGGEIVLTGAVRVTGERRPAGSGTRIGQGAADVFMLDGRRLPPAGTRASLLRRVMP